MMERGAFQPLVNEEFPGNCIFCYTEIHEINLNKLILFKSTEYNLFAKIFLANE